MKNGNNERPSKE